MMNGSGKWRKRRARGEIIIVRFADDFIVGFQYESDARTFLVELRERLEKFNLEVHSDKTRLIRFGRFADEQRRRGGEGKPETFDFLGSTHTCGKTRNGRFKVLRRTKRKKARAKLRELSTWLRLHRHAPIATIGAHLRTILLGHYRYYGVPENYHAMRLFRDAITHLWRTIIRRRSHKSRINWQRMNRIVLRWLPRPEITHPYPEERLRVS